MLSQKNAEILEQMCSELRGESIARREIKQKSEQRKRKRTSTTDRLREKLDGKKKRNKGTARRDGSGVFAIGAGVYGSSRKIPNSIGPNVSKVILMGEPEQVDVGTSEKDKAGLQSLVPSLDVKEIANDAGKMGLASFDMRQCKAFQAVQQACLELEDGELLENEICC